MTRFLLPLPIAINLVIVALNTAQNGDILVRKAPASTIKDIAESMLEIFNSNFGIETVGIREGEKMHETLASKEELLRSENMGDYLRVNMDDRDLNYNKYLSEGDKKFVKLEDYTSQNTIRLTLKEVEAMLLDQPEVISELNQKR